MRPSNRALARLAVGAIASLALISPSFLMAIVWTPIDLVIVVFAIIATVLSAIFWRKLKWAFATMSAALIALPPYPNWIYWGDGEGWYLWVGPALRSFDVWENIFLFILALIFFVPLFWAIGTRQSHHSVG